MTNERIVERVGLTLLGLALIGLTAYWLSLTAFQAGASSPGNLPSSTSTQTQISASSTAGYMTNRNSGCVNRVISTASTTIMIGFASSTPSAVSGHWQAASTTVAYPAEDFGCGLWWVYGFSVGTITITEFY